MNREIRKRIILKKYYKKLSDLMLLIKFYFLRDVNLFKESYNYNWGIIWNGIHFPYSW